MNRILLDIPEVIETKRLILQVPKAGFGEKVHAAVLDGYEDNIKWLNWAPTPPTVEQVEEDCRKRVSWFVMRDFVSYAGIEKSTGEVVGRFGYPDNQSVWEIPQFAISYFVRKSKRSMGYATEAAHALALQAFNVMKAKKVEIHCDAENVASTRIPEHLGFKLEFTKKGGWPRPDGKLAEVKIYSVFSPDELILPDYKA